MSKIVVAEDDKLISDSMCQALANEGFEPHPAYDGESALKEVKNIHPDLVLLDVMMPKLDGLSVLWELKASEATANIPVVVLTNISDVETISKIISGGANDYLIKSEQSVEQIVTKVKEVLERAKATQK